MSRIESIGSQECRRTVQFRAKPDVPLLLAIEEAVVTERLSAGIIVCGVGALEKAVFRNLKQVPDAFPVQPADRLYLEVTRPMELVSLGGWVARTKDDEVEIHAHFSASMVKKETIVTMGGHLNHETICGIKVVVSILEIEPDNVRAERDPLTRAMDIFFGVRHHQAMD